MPSRGLAAAQAVTSTIVSPERTTTAPSACLAIRPVSIENVCRPMVMLRVCMWCLSLREGPAAAPGMSGMDRAGDSAPRAPAGAR